MQETNRLTDIENILVAAKGRGGWKRDGLQFGISRCKALCTEQISNRVLLYSTGPCDKASGKEDGKACIYNRIPLLKAEINM